MKWLIGDERENDDYPTTRDAYMTGVKDVLRIRCWSHRSNAPYNTTADGAECAVCAVIWEQMVGPEELDEMIDAATAVLIDEDTRALSYGGVHKLAESTVRAALAARTSVGKDAMPDGWPDRMEMVGQLMEAVGVYNDGLSSPKQLWERALAAARAPHSPTPDVEDERSPDASGLVFPPVFSPTEGETHG